MDEVTQTVTKTSEPVLPPPVETPPVSPPPAAKPPWSISSWAKQIDILLASCVVIAIAVLLGVIIFGKGKGKPSSPATAGSSVTPATRTPGSISGNIMFQGYAPPGAYLVVVERGDDKSEFKTVLTGFTPATGAIPWAWKDATVGTNYELQAQLQQSGKTLQESPIVNASAPATNLTMNIVSDQQPPAPTQSVISGVIHLDGYIPTGSSLEVLTRQTGSGAFATALSGLSAQDNAQWSLPGVLLGKTYDVEVQLLNGSGTPISTPVIKTVTAPSSGLSFSVSSTAQPPAPAISGLSGTIAINGTIPANSYITLATRPAASSVFNAVGSNLQASNNVSWSWADAQSGSQYDVQAYLWVNAKPYAQSNIITVTAPSTKNVLALNTQQTLAAPDGSTLNVSCNGQQNSLFQATINYNTATNLTNPQTYNIIVTLASQGSQVLNTTLSPTNPSQSQSLTTSFIFTSGTTYYAQYAYSVFGSNTLSPLSSGIQFSCR